MIVPGVEDAIVPDCSFLVAAAASANKIKNRNQQRVKGKVQRMQSVGPDKLLRSQ